MSRESLPESLAGFTLDGLERAFGGRVVEGYSLDELVSRGLPVETCFMEVVDAFKGRAVSAFSEDQVLAWTLANLSDDMRKPETEEEHETIARMLESFEPVKWRRVLTPGQFRVFFRVTGRRLTSSDIELLRWTNAEVAVVAAMDRVGIQDFLQWGLEPAEALSRFPPLEAPQHLPPGFISVWDWALSLSRSQAIEVVRLAPVAVWRDVWGCTNVEHEYMASAPLITLSHTLTKLGDGASSFFDILKKARTSRRRDSAASGSPLLGEVRPPGARMDLRPNEGVGSRGPAKVARSAAAALGGFLSRGRSPLPPDQEALVDAGVPSSASAERDIRAFY